MVCMQHMYRRHTAAAERCEVTVKVMYGRRSRHPGASRVTCRHCQVLNLNSHEGYSYPGTFRQRFNGNNLSIPFVLCLKGEANKEGAARLEMSLKFCHASQRQGRNNHRKNPSICASEERHSHQDVDFAKHPDKVTTTDSTEGVVADRHRSMDHLLFLLSASG